MLITKIRNIDNNFNRQHRYVFVPIFFSMPFFGDFFFSFSSRKILLNDSLPIQHLPREKCDTNAINNIFLSSTYCLFVSLFLFCFVCRRIRQIRIFLLWRFVFVLVTERRRIAEKGHFLLYSETTNLCTMLKYIS